MDAQIEAFIGRFRSIQEQVIREGPESDGFRSADELSREAVAVLGDDVHVLLRAFGRSTPLAHFSLAIAMENARAFSALDPDGDPAPKSGRLMMVALLFQVPTDLAGQRRLEFGAWLPPLPDGRAIPAMADFLLTFEEAYGPLSTLRRLHAALQPTLAGLRIPDLSQRLAEIFGPIAKPSAFDRLENHGAQMSCLRFLPAYAASSDPDWFSNDEQMRQWQREARELSRRKSDRSWFHALAPALYRPAIIAGVDLVLRDQLALWLGANPLPLRDIRAGAQGPTVYLEPFGDQQGVAKWIRFTALREGSYSQMTWPVTNEWEQSQWKEACKRIDAVLRANWACSTVAAPLVQDQEHLFLDRGARRLHVILGRDMTFERAPDGLPWDFESDPELAKWWELEQKRSATVGELIVSTLSALLNVSMESIAWFASFVFARGAWRPAFVLTFAQGQPRASGNSWPLSKEVLEPAEATLSLTLGRQWIYFQHAGEL